jgi:TRAP-type C4-dicarboxylate transport system permease small subunit
MGVLWVAIIGASIATSEKGHIHIDVFSKIFSRPYDKYLDALVNLVATVVCFFFFLVAVKFVSVEKEVGSIIDVLHTPEWVFTLIFPIGFILMTFKFLLCFLVDLNDIKKEAGEVEPE